MWQQNTLTLQAVFHMCLVDACQSHNSVIKMEVNCFQGCKAIQPHAYPSTFFLETVNMVKHLQKRTQVSQSPRMYDGSMLSHEAAKGAVSKWPGCIEYLARMISRVMQVHIILSIMDLDLQVIVLTATQSGSGAQPSWPGTDNGDV